MKTRRLVFRRVGAVVAGFVVIAVVTTITDAILHATGIFPPWGQPMSDALFVVALAYRVVYGIAGGYVTARLAPDNRLRHAFGLGLLGVIASAAGAAATWNAGPEFGPKWYALAVIAISFPCAWLGAKLLMSRPWPPASA